MTFNVDEEIGIIEKYHLSPNELFVVRALLMAQDDEDLEYFQRYMSIPESIRGSLRTLLLSLQDKGCVLKSYKIPEKGEAFEVEDVEFNKNFVKQIYKASFEMGKELFEHYPQWTTINGAQVPLRGVSRKFDSLEDAYRMYGKAIKWKPDVHKEVIELLDWSKEKNILQCSLASFIIDRRWMDLKALKDGDAGNTNFNTIKLL